VGDTFGKIAVAVAAFAAVVFFVNRGDPKPDPEFRDVKYRDTPVDVSEFARFAPEMEPFTLTYVPALAPYKGDFFVKTPRGATQSCGPSGCRTSSDMRGTTSQTSTSS
jgi:hypothetical protein